MLHLFSVLWNEGRDERDGQLCQQCHGPGTAWRVLARLRRRPRLRQRVRVSVRHRHKSL